MILFKITSCPDKSQIGIYQHENSSLVIGSDEADMVIDDPEIDAQQIEVRLEGNQFVIQSLSTKVEVKLNGNRLAKKPVPIKSNDSVTMGNTQIYFTQINDRPLMPPAPWANESIQQRLNRAETPEAVILESLAYLAGSMPRSGKLAPATAAKRGQKK